MNEVSSSNQRSVASDKRPSASTKRSVRKVRGRYKIPGRGPRVTLVGKLAKITKGPAKKIGKS